MIFTFLVAGLIWAGCRYRGIAPPYRPLILAGYFGVICALHIVLPETNPLRIMTGGSAAEWLILSVGIVAFLGYRHLSRVNPAQTPAPQPAKSGAFSEDELGRYARQITLPEIGGAGQRALRDAKVLVVGAGGLGAPALLYLAGAGVGRIGVIDPDFVDLSNLHRQIIHRDDAQDMPKVFSAQQAMAALNPHIDIRPYHRAFTPDIALDLCAEYDLILDGTDTYQTRAMINQAAVAARKPLLSGAISAWEGQITLYDPAHDAPCFACVFPNAPDRDMTATCAQTGVIGALPGVIGAMMALEAIKALTGAGTDLRGRMMIYDAMHADTRMMTLKRAAACVVCGATGQQN